MESTLDIQTMCRTIRLLMMLSKLSMGFEGSKAAADALNSLDDETFSKWVDVIMESSGDLHVLGASDHLLAVIEKIPE